MRLVSAKMLGLTASIALLSLSSVAYAQTTPLTDGGGTSAVPVTATVPPTGDVLLAELTSPYSVTVNTQSVAGTVYSAVYSTTTGTRDFFYQFTVTSGTAPVTSFSASDFGGFTVSDGQSNATDIDGGGPFTNGGTFANLAQLNSGTVQYLFGGTNGTVAVGAKSATLLVRTNAITYNTNNGTVQGGAAANAAIYAPNALSTAPEPGSLLLVIPGALGVVGMIRRRKSA